VRDLRHALELKPTRYEAHATLAQVFEHKNQPAQAIAEWNIAFARESDNAFWNYELGRLLLDNGQLGEAAKHLKLATESAEKDQPKPGWLKAAEFPAAEALRKAGDKKDAIAHYEQFFQLADKNNPDRRDADKAYVGLTGHHYQDER
jgi:tetratricopeptide (TPR) repeat protein